MVCTTITIVLFTMHGRQPVQEVDWPVAQWNRGAESKSLASANQVRSQIGTMGVFPMLRLDYEAAYSSWASKPSDADRFLLAASYHYLVQEFAFPTSEFQKRDVLSRTPKLYGGFQWLSRTGRLTRGAARLGYLVCVSHVGSPDWGKLRSRLMADSSFDPDLWLRAIDGPIANATDAKKALRWADKLLTFEPRNARYLLARSLACESLHARAPSQIHMKEVLGAYSKFVKAIDGDCTDYMRRYTQSHLAMLKSMVPPPQTHGSTLGEVLAEPFFLCGLGCGG